MFMSRKAEKVLRPVVIFDAVEVMNDPAFGKRFPIDTFPDDDVFTSVWMAFVTGRVDSHVYVSTNLSLATFPVMVVLSSLSQTALFV